MTFKDTRFEPFAGAALLATCLLLGGCSLGREPAPSSDLYELAEERAMEEKIDRLEREIGALHEDVRAAENALIAAESGLKGVSTRADAVSALAEARIQVERAGKTAPWCKEELAKAHQRLEESDRQVQDGHFGAAIFFASRAQRVSDRLIREGKAAKSASNTRWISAPRVNMRSGPSTSDGIVAVLLRNTPVFQEKVVGHWALVRTPSGELGWVYSTYLN